MRDAQQLGALCVGVCRPRRPDLRGAQVADRHLRQSELPAGGESPMSIEQEAVLECDQRNANPTGPHLLKGSGAANGCRGQTSRPSPCGR
jgi:hypothetical protein